MSQSMTGEMMSGIPSPTNTNDAPANNVMSQSMMVPSSSLMTSSTSSLNMKTGKKYIPSRSRAELAAKEREREERVRRLKEMQEEDRRRKLEELKQHAFQAQKFREQQDAERRRHIEQLRMKDMDRRLQVEERRKEIEKSELERKEAIIAKNKERDQRLQSQRKNSRSNIEFAFGSSAPRMMEPRVDSASGYWGTRSASGQTVFERGSTSQERDLTDSLRSKRTASAQGLNVSTEGISRENSSASRPGSALSAARPSQGVRMRSTPSRRPRPMSIATTGMTTSMYEERQRPAHFVRDKSLNTPKAERMKRARSVTSDNVGDNEDTRSVSSSQSVGPRTPARKTPSQVKAESAARKAKTSTPKTATPKSSLGNIHTGAKEGKGSSKTPSPALSQDNIESSESKGRQTTPDIIKDNNRKTVDNGEATSDTEKEKSPETDTNEGGEAKEGRRIITSEEEAKARIAEKRREMKEQKEREAELERLRLEEEARKEEERLRQEEEEERRMIALEQEARRAEEERIRKAIEEKEAEDRRKKEEEDKLRAEKEEQERKMKAEAEKREAELQEKLRKEEEERLARKKRIEEIMARTRGAKAGGTPKKDTAGDTPDTNTSQTSAPQQPPSLDSNVDPTKPDLLGDITDKVEEENAKNLGHSKGSTPTPSQDEPEVEKGALDSISSKSDENDNSSPLINIDNGGAPVKKLNGVVEGDSFDQILDLSTVSDSNKTQTELPPPIMAFEESIQTQNNTAGAEERIDDVFKFLYLQIFSHDVWME